MPAQDLYPDAAATAAGPATRIFAVSPYNGVDLPLVTTGLYVSTWGDLADQDWASGRP